MMVLGLQERDDKLKTNGPSMIHDFEKEAIVASRLKHTYLLPSTRRQSSIVVREIHKSRYERASLLLTAVEEASSMHPHCVWASPPLINFHKSGFYHHHGTGFSRTTNWCILAF